MCHIGKADFDGTNMVGIPIRNQLLFLISSFDLGSYQLQLYIWLSAKFAHLI